MVSLSLQSALGKLNHRFAYSIGSSHANETTKHERGRGRGGFKIENALFQAWSYSITRAIPP